VFDRRKPVGDEDRGKLTEVVLQRLRDELLAQGVERAGRFVENEALR